MDFSWTRGIYNQLESIYQDVDDFNKDTMKFVEDQVQSVGVSVKRFCSNVVQDILPLSGDIVETEGQSVNGEQVETQDHVETEGQSVKGEQVETQDHVETEGQSVKGEQVETQDHVETEGQSVKGEQVEPQDHVEAEGQSVKGEQVETQDHVETEGQSVDGEQVETQDQVETEGQSVDGEQVETQDHVETEDGEQVEMQYHVDSVAGIRMKPPGINEEQLSVIQTSIDTLRNFNAPFPIELDHVMRVEENVAGDSITVTANASFDNEIVSGISGDDHKNCTLTIASSPALSAHQEELLTIKEERISCKNFLEDADCLSDVSSSGWLFESILPLLDDPNSDENRSVSAPPVASADKVNEDNCLLVDSPLPSGSHVDHCALGKDGTLCDSFSTKDESVDVLSSAPSHELVFSYIAFNEEEEEEENIVSSTCSASPKPSNTLEPTSANFIRNAENICHSNAEFNGSTCNITTLSSATAAHDTKAVDPLPAFLVLESNDNNAFPNDGSDFVVGYIESTHEHHYKDGQSKLLLSPSETGDTCDFSVGVDDLNMETIDLSPDVKHDERSAVVNGNFAKAASHRRKNFRYYKKLIKDAFTSRKRLSKEYEHVAILYGDIDLESRQHFEPSSAASSSNIPLHAVGTQSFQETCETEWELL